MSAVREEWLGQLQRYLNERVPPRASFLRACLANDARGAISIADDDVTVSDMRAVLAWIYCEAPSEAHGSHEKVARWVAEGNHGYSATVIRFYCEAPSEAHGSHEKVARWVAEGVRRTSRELIAEMARNKGEAAE